MFYLYSTRNTGWLTRSSTYSTDRTEAARFTEDEALAMCARQKTQGGYQLLPVSIELLERI